MTPERISIIGRAGDTDIETAMGRTGHLRPGLQGCFLFLHACVCFSLARVCRCMDYDIHDAVFYVIYFVAYTHMSFVDYCFYDCDYNVPAIC